MNKVNQPINTKNKQRGFTLLEVMVVVVVIGLLGSVVVQNLMGNMDTAKLQKAVQDINGLETSLTMYKMDKSKPFEFLSNQI